MSTDLIERVLIAGIVILIVIIFAELIFKGM